MPRIMLPDAQGKYAPEDEEVVFRFGPRINAGDSATLLYESPYSDPYRAFLEKTKQVPRPEQTDAMRSGIATEPLIFEFYSKVKGIAGVSQAWALYDEADWIQAKADFWNPVQRHLAEFKAPTRDDSGDHLFVKVNKRLPQHYYLQCIHLMEVFDAATFDFVTWRSPDDYALVPVERNTELWLTQLLPAYMEFWERVQAYVQRGEQWPAPSGTTVDTSEERAMHARRWREGQAMAREAKAWIAIEEAWLKRNSAAKTTLGGGLKALWAYYKPRWSVTISAESEAAYKKIIAAVSPLENKAGVAKIVPKFSPQDYRFRVSEEATKGE